MLSLDTVKSFIGHHSERVRMHILDYIDNGNIRDPEILPLALDAFDRYGNQENLFFLYKSKGQPVSDESARRLLKIIEDQPFALVARHAANLLNNASLAWLETAAAKNTRNAAANQRHSQVSY